MRDKHQGVARTDAGTKGQRTVTPPPVSLPRGGGAIRSIGETFRSGGATGTSTLTVPIPTSPARAEFGPHLTLSYSSGAGNGPFGLGWSLSLPSISRKIDKLVPRYDDQGDSDPFLLSGDDDLVPELVRTASGSWEHQRRSRTLFGIEYTVRRYRPRVEGTFSRIEHWTKRTDPRESFWRILSRDNVTAWYGKSAESRITDPGDASRIFTWLICESYDDRGNAIAYRYAAENEDELDLSQAHERNRDAIRRVNRYPKRIHYGNRTPYRPDLAAAAAPLPNDWCFEVVFDYGEHATANPLPTGTSPWKRRVDPFSSYRAGFEIRTYRLCRRVLMFHHFPGENIGVDRLVRSIDFTYGSGEKPHTPAYPEYSYLLTVTQRAFEKTGAAYASRAQPPLDLEYSRPRLSDEVREAALAALENLPEGFDGTRHQWADLDGEGAPGTLTRDGAAWFYKRNLSPVPDDSGESRARFGAMELVARRPSAGGPAANAPQLLDLAGDGQLDVVEFEGTTPGFYERTELGDWSAFVPFQSLPVIDWRNPNLCFLDLTGDGRPDLLISEGDLFRWHESLGEAGFGPARIVHAPVDEESGPRVLFADGGDTIFLADLSGDGLTDIVRIAEGEVCYWPNLGFGRFGSKVTMDAPPSFDRDGGFDGRRVRLADIDGSGTTDIVYLASDGVHVYFNECGNGWSARHTLLAFPVYDELASVSAVDLLGTGTACLVWSSPLDAHARRPVRYVDLMDGQKPHLLIGVRNNLGSETRIEYAPSTRFAIEDRLNGQPWATRLPFPVHCVAKVTVADKWRQAVFSTSYSYHHGYFDGIEREFRGFGRVDEVDVESYGAFARANGATPFVTDDETLYQPPVKTVTWFHTGAPLTAEKWRTPFASEQFPQWLERERPGALAAGGFRERAIADINLGGEELDEDEWREAMRACKGMTLREEKYELDVDALERGQHRPVRLFFASDHTCQVQRLQPKRQQAHGVFLALEREALTYHYELDLTAATIVPDPRVSHTLELTVDELGHPLQSFEVTYPRVGTFADASLPPVAETWIRDRQRELVCLYTERRYTTDRTDDDLHRLRMPCESITYQVTGISPEDADDLGTPDSADNRYFDIDELSRFRLSLVHQTAGLLVTDIPYQQIATGAAPEKRRVEHLRTLFFDDSGPALTNPFPLGTHGRLGAVYESYTLALTESLLTAIYGARLDAPARALLTNRAVSGYLSGAALTTLFGAPPVDGEYWVPSGISGFAADAADRFYLPERFTDPFGNVTTIEYDAHKLLVAATVDAKENATRVTRFDYRTLAPRRIQDANGNFSEVWFDRLGSPAAVALEGKGTQGDSLAAFTAAAHIDTNSLAAFFDAATFDEAAARVWLGNATVRHVYSFGETIAPDGSILWATHPPAACSIRRERHVAGLAAGDVSPLQAEFEYSDGTGSIIAKKVQAEPAATGGPLRWIASGKVVLNNKGNPVKQYEPYFSSAAIGHRFEDPREEGVTSIVYYDALSRPTRTEHADGSVSRVEFSPWQMASFDRNDTVDEPGNAWLTRRTAATATPDAQREAAAARAHAGTATVDVLDSLGREVASIVHNRTVTPAGPVDRKLVTRTRFDVEGKPLWVRDPRGNLVEQFISPAVPADRAVDPVAGFAPSYDIAGNVLFHHSMDSGPHWRLNDAGGKAMFSWDENERQDLAGAIAVEQRAFVTQYDELHRPIEQWLTIGAGAPQLVEKFEYVDTKTNPSLADARDRNLCGQLHRHLDGSGLIETVRMSFQGVPEEARRQLPASFDAPVIAWQPGSPTAALEPEVYTRITEHDAMSRPLRLYDWHRTVPGSRVSVHEARYNARGILDGVSLVIRATKTPTGHAEGAGAQRTDVIRGVTYDAKGQRQRIEYGNGVMTRYHYDPETFRVRQIRTTRRGFDPAFPSGAGTLVDPQVLQNLHYAYDAVGNVIEVRDDAYEPAFFKNQSVEAVSRYTYDASYRLVRATGREDGALDGPPPQLGAGAQRIVFPVVTAGALRNYAEAYEYDDAGNLGRVRHAAGATGSWTQTHTHAADSNRLLTTTNGAAPAITYRHDRHGNLLNLANVAIAQSMRWDYRDTLHFLDLQGGGRAFYTYGSARHRVRKRVERLGGIVEETVDLDGLERTRRFVAGALVEEIETTHLFDGERRVLLVEDVLVTDVAGLAVGPHYRFQLTNHLGSAVLEVDEAAGVISYEEYRPYGSTAYQAARNQVDAPKRYGFIGRERDGETGLQCHGARYYAVWLGRWIGPDPSGTAGGLNVYAYGDGAPTMFVDADGHAPQATNSAEDLMKFVRDTGGFVAGEQKKFAVKFTEKASRNLKIAKKAASPFGTEAHIQMAAVVKEIKEINPKERLKDAERLYAEVVIDKKGKILRHAHSVAKQSGPGGAPKDSAVPDLAMVKKGVKDIVGKKAKDVIETIGDAKYGGGSAASRYGRFATKLKTVANTVKDKVVGKAPSSGTASSAASKANAIGKTSKLGSALKVVKPLAIVVGVLALTEKVASAADSTKAGATDKATRMEQQFDAGTAWAEVGVTIAGMVPGHVGRITMAATMQAEIAKTGIELTGQDKMIVEQAKSAENLAKRAGWSDVNAETAGATTAAVGAIGSGGGVIGAVAMGPIGWAGLGIQALINRR